MKEILLTTILFTLSLLYCDAQNRVYTATEIAAAENADAKTQNAIGDNFYYGNGVEQDVKAAFKWYKKAADKEYTEAIFNVGYAYFYGEGVEKDCIAGLDYLRKAAASGHVNAVRMIEATTKTADGEFGEAYDLLFTNSRPNSRLIAQAKDQLIAETQQGNPLAAFYLYFYYTDKKELNMAFTYLKKAYNMLYPNDTLNWDAYDKAKDITNQDFNIGPLSTHVCDYMGWCHEFGYGVKQDYQKAIFYYQKSFIDGYRDAFFPHPDAVHGDIRAAICYGKMGDGVKMRQTLKDWESWIQGHFWTAEMYYLGICTQKDYQKAISNYKAVIEEEHNWELPAYQLQPKTYGDACYRMSQIYREGLGVEKDTDMSELYFRYAVKYGSERALYEYQKEYELKNR